MGSSDSKVDTDYTGMCRNEPNEQILLVLHNALHQLVPLNVRIGDVVLTDRAFYFIRYHDFQYFGSLGSGAGALLGGPVGALKASTMDKNNLTNARDVANELRPKLYGSLLADRIKQCPESLVFPSAYIKGLHASSTSGLSLTTRDGKRFDYIVPPMNAQYLEALNNWPESTSQYDESSDPDGFLMGTISPRELLQRVQSGNSSAVMETYRLGQREEFAFALYSELNAKNKAERQAFWAIFESAPEIFRNSLLITARRESIDGARKFARDTFYTLFAAGFFGWLTLNVIREGRLDVKGIFLILFGVAVVIGMGRLAFGSVRKIRRAKEAKVYLKSK